ncbi:PTS sugar transporter subunit IIA [Vagococcus lutrae]|uniref:PTS sugar transporter subunit IIA n=1 Tax=Vagococcus lutrae TaxID=81947 RepID=UPI00200D4A4D|nr:PTS beta-glucoside transporter subunit IIA [Vagococcus lutrae]MDY3705796.1 PTS beta-glucoside transporter subunit IIA [Vagococcus lutrae]UQF37678.1 PTS beta-glucoside transporter subunit IIA [Vagococcus lutrae]
MSNSIGLLIMTHGDFGKEAIKSAELIVGKQDNYETLSVFVVDEIDNLKTELLNKISGLNTSEGLVIFTDIVGGTPYNLASYLLEQENTMVVTALNMSMLISFLIARTGKFKNMESILRESYEQGFNIRTKLEIEGEDEDGYSL